MQYQNIDDAVQLVKNIGPGALLTKVDIENAFRIMPIAQESQHLLGFILNDKFYFDKSTNGFMFFMQFV